MAIEVANVRSNGVMVSEEEETTKVVVPTKIEEAGRKYCCATCFNSYGRVTHVALEKRVTLKLNAILSGQKGPNGQRYYTNPYGLPGETNSVHNYTGVLHTWTGKRLFS
ncbi:uncharacterized protein LOC113330021 isoform X2 [Papaver somniferum]|uniref:uncharacterized protein LOC113330021 isoform X2 n=1 Tax=Papaver somniferum TaxID=3469 RepID=UPI000E6F8165|nr:uncharacterized protein LOC113330021 isoform X2 [Papaver somniferum]